jgi:DNA topoisomerase-3
LKRNFTAAAFINNMKRVDALVYEVRSETKRANISHAELLRNAAPAEKKTAGIAAESCPKCQNL